MPAGRYTLNPHNNIQCVFNTLEERRVAYVAEYNSFLRCLSVIGPENQMLVLKFRCARLCHGIELGPRLLCRSAFCLQDGLGQDLMRPMDLM